MIRQAGCVTEAPTSDHGPLGGVRIATAPLTPAVLYAQPTVAEPVGTRTTTQYFAF